MPAQESHPEIELLNEMQRFLRAAVHDLRAAQRRTGTAAELLLQAGDQEREAVAAQLLQGLSKTEELLTGIGRYATALTPASYAIHLFPSISAVRFALAHLENEIRETSATIDVGDLPDIAGDRNRLAELFEHLIGNALKFRGPDPPAVEIGARRTAEGWRFSVKDNGIGIAPKYRDRLFIPFRRLHGAEVPGAGLGLAISQKIVAAHRGRIWIEDGSPSGVTFFFILPAADGD
ncbi:MAG TPA: ATP-binding protein [Bryobacteraceae bacterium]|jgi:light-regulated signal transduction histidine kinase (bacteriophytochrome)|nr:ATP-binding protein [Bryobacteraceae bacterium]